MPVFLDTEFTNLLCPQLLSVGMVTIDEREFYAEIDLNTDLGKHRVKASLDFVRNGGVLAQWGLVPNATRTEWEIGRRADEWLLELALEAGKKLEIAFDYSDDYDLLEAAIRRSGLWDRVRLVTVPVNVNAFTGCTAGGLAAEACFRELAEHGERGLKRHHALADAMALRAAYRAVKGAALL